MHHPGALAPPAPCCWLLPRGQNVEFQRKIRNFGAKMPCFSYLPPSRGRQTVTGFPTGDAQVQVFALGSHISAGVCVLF